MKHCYGFSILILLLSSCGIIEKSSRHDFQSGFYKFNSPLSECQRVYVEAGDRITAYGVQGKNAQKKPLIDISLQQRDSICHYPVRFSRNSMDIDFTSVLFKFRPSVSQLPPQLSTEFNASVYAGWRHDNYYIKTKADPLGRCNYTVVNRGYDFGVFVGPGSTVIGPFSTKNLVTDEYNGFVLQYGVAGFLESGFASFGISVGMDKLIGPDRKRWIYHNRPWIGFMVGVALN